MADARRSRAANRECSISRAMDAVGDRWSVLVLREAYYGVTRFDQFQYYIGLAPNILSSRLKKLVEAGIMTRVPLPEHSGRYEYVLTEKGRAFFPTYLALKKWGDDWLAEPEGPQVVFNERANGREVVYPELRGSDGAPLRLEDVEVAAGSGAVPFNRRRFSKSADAAPAKRSRKRSS
jgi:DNA-binding HxlR family transcriptional regulator